MSITVNQTNGNKTLTWAVTALAEKMDNVFNDAGEHWYNSFTELQIADISWTNLTNTQKKSVLNGALKKVVKEAATAKYVNLEVDGVKATAIEDALTRYELND